MAATQPRALRIESWELERVRGELLYHAGYFDDLGAEIPREITITLNRAGAPRVAFLLVRLPAGDPALGAVPGPALAYQSWDAFSIDGDRKPWTVILRELR